MKERAMNILIIEDDEDDYVLVRDLLSTALSRRCVLDWVTTYDAALERIKQGSHDACLLDYRLGERDGLNLLHEVNHDGCKMPIIFLTGNGDYNVDVEAMRAGAADYLVKGEISVPLIERSIRYAIERKKTEEQLKEYATRLEQKNKELSEALEELHAAEEELREKNRRLKAIHDQLRHQNEELISAHETAKIERLRYMDLFEYAPDGYILTDADGIISEINRQAEELIRSDRENVQGKSIVNFVTDEDSAIFLDQMERLKKLRSLKNWQVRLQPCFADPFHAEISVTSVLPRANEGSTLRWSIRDVSERNRIEQELEKHRERLEELIERRTAELSTAKAEMERKAMELDAALSSIGDGVIIFSPDRRITRVNALTESLLGPITGKLAPMIEEKTDPFDFRSMDGSEIPFEELPVNKAFRGKKVVSRQLSIHNKESDKRWNIILSASPIKTRDGECLGVIATFTDMTRQVELTQELRRARDELELRVRERTAELSSANEALRSEIEEHRRTQVALIESEKQLRFLSSQLLSAQEEERKRISREIHDSLGSSFSAIKLALENASQRLSEESGAREMLRAIVSITQGGIEEVRRIMTDLRPFILDDLGIIATIGWLCRQCETVCPQICIEQDICVEESEIPDHLKIVIFRVIQEALNNMRKYSSAELVSLSLGKKGSLIELVVEDNGNGFDVEDVLSRRNSEKGLGLTSMKERIELCDGLFSIESALGEGTIVRATWPCSPDVTPDNDAGTEVE